MCRHFLEDFDLDTKVARYHNIYGPLGTFDGGREKSPAALCRKIAQAKIKKIKEIEVWGDGDSNPILSCLLRTVHRRYFRIFLIVKFSWPYKYWK
jgi:GDP-D-mannose 3',5'-epimerase